MIENTPPLLPGEAGRETEAKPVTGFGEAVDAVLREPKRVYEQIGKAGGGRLLMWLALLNALGLAGYGLLVGTFTGGTQLWAAPVKVAGGMLAAGLICLPSLYIFSCLAGSRASLRQVGGLVVGLIAIMTLLLLGFAPVAWVFAQSTDSVSTMGTLHLLFWSVSMVFAGRFFGAGFTSIIVAKDPGVLRVWLTVFVVVVLQMTTALRPIVGQSETFLPTEKKFFLKHWVDSVDTESGMKRRGTYE